MTPGQAAFGQAAFGQAAFGQPPVGKPASGRTRLFSESEALDALRRGDPMPGYEPLLPHGLPNPGADADPTADRGGVAWDAAPAGSHVWGWRYYGVDEFPFLRRFPSAVGRGRSELHVAFKDGRGGKTNTFVYFFRSPEAGRAVLEKLRGSPHPFADVVKPLLIDAGVPYTRL